MSAAVMYAARRHARPRLALLLLTLLLIAASLVHLGLGARWIAPQTVLQALLEYNPRNFDQRIIVDLRLVRLAAALLTGAALGVAGLLLQTVIRNPLGEPHILGLNAGASLAVVATSALGLSLGAFPAGRPLTALRRGSAVRWRDGAGLYRARRGDDAAHHVVRSGAVSVCVGGDGGDIDPR